nr:DExH-box ATP-dependent RNA helicase DExH14 [Tanacetum cinerariifolium]
MEQYLESGGIIVSIKVDSYVVSLDGQDVLETSADIKDDGKLHVTMRNQMCSEKLGFLVFISRSICSTVPIYWKTKVLIYGSLTLQVIYIAPLKVIVQERMNDWKNGLVSKLRKKIVEMTGNYMSDLMALMSADIIISTPEKWDGISRNWHSRSYVMKVGLMILDEIHLLGTNRGPILEG